MLSRKINKINIQQSSADTAGKALKAMKYLNSLPAGVRTAVLAVLVTLGSIALANCGDETEVLDCAEGETAVAFVNSDGDLDQVCKEVAAGLPICKGVPVEVTVDGQKTTVCAEVDMEECAGQAKALDVGGGIKLPVCELPPETNEMQCNGQVTVIEGKNGEGSTVVCVTDEPEMMTCPGTIKESNTQDGSKVILCETDTISGGGEQGSNNENPPNNPGTGSVLASTIDTGVPTNDSGYPLTDNTTENDDAPDSGQPQEEPEHEAPVPEEDALDGGTSSHDTGTGQGESDTGGQEGDGEDEEPEQADPEQDPADGGTSIPDTGGQEGEGEGEGEGEVEEQPEESENICEKLNIEPQAPKTVCWDEPAPGKSCNEVCDEVHGTQCAPYTAADLETSKGDPAGEKKIKKGVGICE